MPDLYVCGFTRVAYVLRHAKIRVQGYTEVFNRRHKWDIGVSDDIYLSLHVLLQTVLCYSGSPYILCLCSMCM